MDARLLLFTSKRQEQLLHIALILEVFAVILLADARIPLIADISGHFESLSFKENYATIFGEPNILEDRGNVQLKLDEHSGSGFISQDNYYYGFFSASIKLPANYAAGVVIAFYTSNGDAFPQNHDELDFEFLGNIPGREWNMQTNIYGNGSVARGREERFNFWFDPTADFHDFSILWNPKHIVFMVDNIPIREMLNIDGISGDYPSKPMALYATIWDGSGWATDGGKYPVNYEHAPFVATFTNFKLQGCVSNPEETLQDHCESSEFNNPDKSSDLLSLSAEQKAALEWVRTNYMYYSYCDDKGRYPVSLPECSQTTEISHSVNGQKIRKSHSRRSKRSSKESSSSSKESSSTKIKERGRSLISESFSSADESIKFVLPPALRLPLYTRRGNASGN
eukprot:c22471_g1_i5 orf=843-2030(-)